jgi:DNA anti-recombination protein RmuC
MAFAVYTSALLVTAIFAWLAIQYNVASSVAQLAIALTGNGLGGFALVLGILRDDRVQKAEEETAKARQETAQAKQRADEFQKLYVELQQQAEQERQRAERAEAELQRLRAEHDNEINARFRRLEIAAGITPPDASDDATEN